VGIPIVQLYQQLSLQPSFNVRLFHELTQKKSTSTFPVVAQSSEEEWI